MIVEKMSERIPEEYLKKQKIGNRPEFTYIPIDKVILSLNRKFADNWDINIDKIDPIPGATGFTVVVSLSIFDDDKIAVTRCGVGADIHQPSRHNPNAIPDVDKIIKTAYANAVKKAANMFGLGSELWDDSNTMEPTPEPEPTPKPPEADPKPNAEPEPKPEATSEPKPEPKPEPTQDPTPAPEAKTPGILSTTSKQKVQAFLDETKLTRNELSEYLKSMYPNSDGNPGFLTVGDEEKNVSEFLDKVRTEHTKE